MGNTVIISVGTREEFNHRIKQAFRTGKKQSPRITFPTTALFFEVLTTNRLALLQALTGQGPMSTREIARRLGRDVHAVHNDVHALINAGILEREEDGVSFPFDAIRLDVTLTGSNVPAPRRRRRKQEAA